MTITPLPTAREMRALDARTIEEIGVPGIALMENAGNGAARALRQTYGPMRGRRVVIFCGPGNNGGDGLVIARHLHQEGGRPEVVLLADPDRFSGDAATNLAVVRRLPIPLHVALDEEAVSRAAAPLNTAHCLVDALFGTGLARPVTGRFAAAVEVINRAGRPVLAVDIASGLDSDTGQILGTAVRADLTVTFGLAKPGHWLYPGREHTGRLKVVDIGIPPEVVADAHIVAGLLTRAWTANALPLRPPAAHKGTCGHMLVLAGSTGKTGAALLTARGGLRIGSGLVSLCVPADLDPIFETALAEAMTIAVHACRGNLDQSGFEEIQAALAGKRAAVLGPGIGTAPPTAALAQRLYADADIPLVVDADACTILGREPKYLGQAKGPRILTPHPGEMSRLTGLGTKEIQADRLTVARDFAQRYGVVLLLKGASTVIAAPDGRVAINPTGNPGMAAGGMGDVLSGVIGGLLAQGLSPWRAACCGAFLHGLAADSLARERPQGYLASEVADRLPQVVRELRAEHPTAPTAE